MYKNTSQKCHFIFSSFSTFWNFCPGVKDLTNSMSISFEFYYFLKQTRLCLAKCDVHWNCKQCALKLQTTICQHQGCNFVNQYHLEPLERWENTFKLQTLGLQFYIIQNLWTGGEKIDWNCKHFVNSRFSIMSLLRTVLYSLSPLIKTPLSVSYCIVDFIL